MNTYRLETCGGCDKSCMDVENRFERRVLSAGRRLTIKTMDDNAIFCLLSGRVYLDSPQFGINTIEDNHATLLYVGGVYEITSLEDADYMLIRFLPTVNICQTISPDVIRKMAATIKSGFHTININDALKRYIDNVSIYYRNNIKCYYLYQSKTLELFVIFRHYYSIEDITRLFYQLLESDFFFKSLVLNNHRKAKNVEHLAELCGYGVSNFKHTFKRTFNQTPYKWMKENMANDLIDMLKDVTVPIKMVAFTFNFSDQSHLTAYCKKHFGATPTQIRRS